MWTTEGSGLFHSKNCPFCEDSMELQMHENHAFFLPVNILMVWRVGFLGRTTHYRVSLYHVMVSSPCLSSPTTDDNTPGSGSNEMILSN